MSHDPPPRLEAIFIAPNAGAPMQRIHTAELIAAKGIKGDRYALGTGYYSQRYACELTAIAAEALDRIAALHHIAIHEGQHRRNLITRGLTYRDIAGKHLRIGTALLAYEKPRPQCHYLERLTQPGMVHAMSEGPGICLRILQSGTIHEGDPIEIIPAAIQPRVLP